jgi:Bacterial Ig-like domain (group 3)/IPT/TIG domain
MPDGLPAVYAYSDWDALTVSDYFMFGGSGGAGAGGDGQEQDPPTVTGVSPNSGSLSAGNSVAVTGTCLSMVTAVNFGSLTAPSFTINSDSSITVTPPASPNAGPVDVTVVTPGGTSAISPADVYTYQFGTNTVLASSANPASAGQMITFTATVAHTTGTRTPTGRVVFKDGTAVLGSVLLDARGRASLATAALSTGTHGITAVYEGASLFAPSASNSLSQTIHSGTGPAGTGGAGSNSRAAMATALAMLHQGSTFTPDASGQRDLRLTPGDTDGRLKATGHPALLGSEGLVGAVLPANAPGTSFALMQIRQSGLDAFFADWPAADLLRKQWENLLLDI